MLTRAIFFIENISSGLYLLCAVALLFSSRQLMLARQEVRVAEFELERELARKKQASAVTRTLGLVELLLAIFAISSVIAPTVRTDLTNFDVGLVAAEMTNVPFMTSTPGGSGQIVVGEGTQGGIVSIENLMASVTAQAGMGEGGPVIRITPTITPTFVGTINPDVGPVLGCDTPDATLEVPANGQVIFDSLEVRGTANAPNFALYKFELSGPSTGNAFTPFGGDKISPVPQKGSLGQLALSGFQPGFYQFRLAVFDNTNTLRASCTVTVELRERPPTITPPGGS